MTFLGHVFLFCSSVHVETDMWLFFNNHATKPLFGQELLEHLKQKGQCTGNRENIYPRSMSLFLINREFVRAGQGNAPKCEASDHQRLKAYEPYVAGTREAG